MTSESELAAKIASRNACVGVIGLGYVGLPLACTVARVGFQVLGFDVDQGKLASLKRGQLYIKSLPDHIFAKAEGRLQVVSAFTELAKADILVVCVPTPLTRDSEPDLSHVHVAAQQISEILHAGQLVILESTVYPGGTRDVFVPVVSQRGLELGRDVFVAFSPEREDPGNLVYHLGNTPKVVAGLEPHSLGLAARFYSWFVPEVIPVSSTEVAETSKLLENTYRAVNIALVNELKRISDRLNINVWEVIEAAKSKPFGFQAFYPGPGVGGHCIPVDPHYLIWAAQKHGVDSPLVRLAQEVNAGMPAFVVQKIQQALANRRQALSGSSILLLGMAYKRDIADARGSPGAEIYRLLAEQGARVDYHDPHVPQFTLADKQHRVVLASVPLTEKTLSHYHAVVIVTDHSDYDWDWIVAHSAMVVDTRNATKEVFRFRERIVLA
ncbi:MAG: UDP-N-acetyl-D-glucosamine dehydrogenase [Gemmatales bacterium]|nr:MAG: UDP-N-acetyl-D-glucosamine dehydrogenase [Gemmatales bacterium]